MRLTLVLMVMFIFLINIVLRIDVKHFLRGYNNNSKTQERLRIPPFGMSIVVLSLL